MIVDAELKRIERGARVRRAEIHALASLIAIGTHNPKQFPPAGPFIDGGPRRAGSSDAAIAAYFLTLQAEGNGHGQGSDRRTSG